MLSCYLYTLNPAPNDNLDASQSPPNGMIFGYCTTELLYNPLVYDPMIFLVHASLPLSHRWQPLGRQLAHSQWHEPLH